MAEKILVVDDEDIIRESLSYVLANEGYEVDQAENGRVAYEKAIENSYDLIITDIEMPQMKGTELLEKVSAVTSTTSFIVITAYGSLDTAIKALRSGAHDYILKPVEFDELSIKLRRLFDLKRLLQENQLLRKELQRTYDFSNIIGKSAAMKNIFEMVQTVAQTDSTVLITGNSGTGKELIARAIHYNSKRKGRPFIAVNCGAISENLIESELFGHKKGAFTGAISDKEGYMRAAEGGTLFLDEVSEMPLQLQVKLLRVIQEKECIPVGSSYPFPVNIRFVASTNRNLPEEISKGHFREDLFYRLNVVDINLPSLKQRRDDIPLLVDYFIDKYRTQMGKNIRGVDSSVLRAIMNYEWKGEVRELENAIERAVIFARGDLISMNDLPDTLRSVKEIPMPEKSGSLDEFMKRVEKEFIIRALENSNYDKEKAATTLNLGLSTLYRKIKDLEIEI